MQDNDYARANKGVYIVGLIIVAFIVLAGCLSYLQLMKWHRAQVQTLLAEHEATTAELKKRIRQLEEQLANASDRQDPATSERIAEVFGRPPETTAESMEEPRETFDCERLREKMETFFSYLDQRKFVNKADMEEKSSQLVFEEMIRLLSENPPLVVGETRDIVTLTRNQAHFFRILKKERLELVKHVLTIERDVLEEALAVFYAYYVDPDQCEDQEQPLLSLDTLYSYAGFFLNTLSGKSYLMRRDSPLRSLTRYYSVLILDLANQAELNRHGIDIRPLINLTLDDIRNQKSLSYQDIYIKRLLDLKSAYHLD